MDHRLSPRWRGWGLPGGKVFLNSPNVVCPQGCLQLPQHLCRLLNSPLKLGAENESVGGAQTPTVLGQQPEASTPTMYARPFTFSLPHHLHTPAQQNEQSWTACPHLQRGGHSYTWLEDAECPDIPPHRDIAYIYTHVHLYANIPDIENSNTSMHMHPGDPGHVRTPTHFLRYGFVHIRSFFSLSVFLPYMDSGIHMTTNIPTSLKVHTSNTHIIYA